MSERPRFSGSSVWYYASLVLVVVTLVLTVCSFIYPWPGQLGFLCFLGVFAMYTSSGSFDRDDGRKKLPRPWKVIDWLLLTLRALALPFAPIVFAFGASGPAIIDGQYCLTSHGEIVSFISEESFRFRSMCEQMMFVSICLPFAADASIQCRARFLLIRESAHKNRPEPSQLLD